LLKSGTSFKKDRIQKVAKLFHKNEASAPINEMTEEMQKIRGADFRSIDIDTEIPRIDARIKEITELLESTEKREEKDDLTKEMQTLKNKRID
jgi:predicted  nucleic acid-binding Zn-ribbon protein